MTDLTKRKPYRNKKILQSARDQACTLNSPKCNHNPETTVFCHLNEGYAGKGMGQKADDYAGFYGCSACHSYYDSLDCGSLFDSYILQAVIKTWRRLLDKGIIK